jgi:hypothetical protein
MKHVHSFDNFLNEASASSYKHVVQTALKQLGYDVKQSDLKVGVKKEKLYDLITLNGELLCSSSDFAQMTAWIQNAVKEDPAKYGLDPKVLESTNEGQDLSYWKDYEVDASPQSSMTKWMADKCTSQSDVVKCIDKSITAWNKSAEEDGGDRVSKASEKHIGDLAMQFFKKFGYINGNIIYAMIMQES